MIPVKKLKPGYVKGISNLVGDVGEVIVRRHLKKMDWTVFGQAFPGTAPIDGFAIRPKIDGCDVIAFEVKTYPRRFAYPQTGIDSKDFYTYKEVSKELPLSIIFVDPFECCMYGLPFRDNLEKGVFEGIKVYFDLALMKKIRGLTKEELRAINWKPTPHYQGVEKFFK